MKKKNKIKQNSHWTYTETKFILSFVGNMVLYVFFY